MHLLKILNFSNRKSAARIYAKEFNTRFTLMNDAAKGAIENKLMNNKEVEELRSFLKQRTKNELVTDSICINKIEKEGKGIALSGEFFADPLICEDITFHSNNKIITPEELEAQMAEFRIKHELDKLATPASDRAERLKAEAMKNTDLYRNNQKIEYRNSYDNYFDW